MKQFTEEEHRDALLRRRIKFVVEKGAMARLFRAGTHSLLQEKLFILLQPTQIASLQSCADYDAWLLALIRDDCWEPYSQNGLEEDRWAYFAKLLNIVIYEVVSNRELFSEDDWKRLHPCLHIPLDANVFNSLTRLDSSFPARSRLKGMGESAYLQMQDAVRKLAAKHSVPPIWFLSLIHI